MQQKEIIQIQKEIKAKINTKSSSQSNYIEMVSYEEIILRKEAEMKTTIRIKWKSEERSVTLASLDLHMNTTTSNLDKQVLQQALEEKTFLSVRKSENQFADK